jgi:hypothetical protein
MPQLFSNRKKINVTPTNYRDCQRGERERERDAAKNTKAKAKCQIGHRYRCKKNL